MSNQNEFADPYANLPEAVKGRVYSTDCVHSTSVKISGKDRSLMLGVHGGRPTIQTTIAILTHRLVNELRNAGITEYDPAVYEHAVGGLRVTLGRSPDADRKSHPETPDGNDRAGTSGLARPADSPPPQPADASSARKSRGNNSKGGKASRATC